MAYINSSKLHIFPASQRTINTQDNWISEYNLSSIVNQFMDPTTEGFVISKEIEKKVNLDGSISIGSIEFNIKGYYFKVDDASTIKDAVEESSTEESSTKTSFVTFDKSGDYYTATIYLGGTGGVPILLGSDESTASTSGTAHSIDLFDADYNIPATSRLSVVGLTSVGGNGLSISVKGSSIQSYSVEAESSWKVESGQSNSKVKIENGKITSFTLDAVSDSNNSKVKIENGKITSFTLDDGTL